MLRPWALAAAALACVSASSSEALQITSQQRYVEAVLHDGPTSGLDPLPYHTIFDSERHDAPDLGPFQAEATVSGSNPAYGGGGFGGIPFSAGGSATQDSTIAPDSITGSLSLSTNGFGPDIGADVASILVIGFDIAELTAYEVGGTLDAWGSSGGLTFRLVQDGVFPGLFSFSDPDFSTSGPKTFSGSGWLVPGHYTLIARAVACGGEIRLCGFGQHSLSFVFIVPEPASGGLVGIGLIVIALIRRRSRAAD